MPIKRPKQNSKVSSDTKSVQPASGVPQRRGVDEDGFHSQASAMRRERAAQPQEERFYNQPSAEADWGYWAKAEYWTMDEAVALSFSKDPRVVDWERLREMHEAWEYAVEYGDRLEFFERAVASRALSRRSKPEVVLAWMTKQGIDVPSGAQAEFERLYAKRGPASEELQAAIRDLEARLASMETELAVSQQEAQRLRSQIVDVGAAPRRTDEKMILAMAVKKFQFKPEERNSAATNIASLCHEAGYPVSERTVRDRLRTIAERQRAGDWET